MDPWRQPPPSPCAAFRSRALTSFPEGRDLSEPNLLLKVPSRRLGYAFREHVHGVDLANTVLLVPDTVTVLRRVLSRPVEASIERWRKAASAVARGGVGRLRGDVCVAVLTSAEAGEVVATVVTIDRPVLKTKGKGEQISSRYLHEIDLHVGGLLGFGGSPPEGLLLVANKLIVQRSSRPGVTELTQVPRSRRNIARSDATMRLESGRQNGSKKKEHSLSRFVPQATILSLARA